MTEAYDGREVVGMDLHRRRSVLVRMSGDGRKLETARISNSPAALRRQIARAGKHPRVVLEATYGWYWAADTLAEAGAEVHLAHPLGVKGFAYRRVKNDVRDAADLADLLRMGRLPEAWIAPHQVRELRELTRYRHKLVRLRTSCKDQVHAILAKLGIPAAVQFRMLTTAGFDTDTAVGGLTAFSLLEVGGLLALWRCWGLCSRQAYSWPSTAGVRRLRRASEDERARSPRRATGTPADGE
jgi:transposase